MARELRYSLIPGPFAICQLPAKSAIPEWATRGELFSISAADEEVSVVCDAKLVPAGVKAQSPFICLKLHGPFPLTETGVLSSFIQPLSKRGIPIFAVSTFNTDYVLIPQKFWDAAKDALKAARHLMA